MGAALEKERKFFKDHQSEWRGAYPGKFVLVKGEALIGVFDSDTTAVSEGIQRFGLESFLVRNVAENEEAIRIPALMFGLLHANSPSPA
ncbi:MAG TPA: hypothetical protein VN829_11670 [Dongiaceae bacterium]|nr:hypothetical protein [Dongiaceae bacterium]